MEIRRMRSRCMKSQIKKRTEHVTNESRTTRPEAHLNELVQNETYCLFVVVVFFFFFFSLSQYGTYIFVLVAVVDSYIVQKPFVRVRENCTQSTRRTRQHLVNLIG